MGVLEKNQKFAFSHRKYVKFTDLQCAEIERRRDEWIERLYLYYDFSDKYQLSYDLKKGEIYEVDWGMNINAEFSGRHYGVVLADSGPKNPLVLMIPLKSNHKAQINPNSDLLLGMIDDLPTASESVAVFNQIRAIDKVRIYTQLAIGPSRTNYRLEESQGNFVKVYRLNDEQLNKLTETAAKMLFGINK